MTFADKGFFQRLTRLLPLLAVYVAVDLLLPAPHPITEFAKRLLLALAVLFIVRALNALLDGLHDISQEWEPARHKPLRGYLQAVKIVAFLLAFIFAIAILTDTSPWGIVSLLGGLTAVLLLIFKDTILGLVASLQLSGNDMVRIGDWIEMPKYGADGDVIDISIHTVKVRNWDKTIATIPTYALVSDTFKNWRGMQESGGRRIKRALCLDMNTITFCSDEMLERFKRIDLIRDYIASRQAEIEEYNRQHRVDTSLAVNGRRQTNIGVFRAYVVAYLKAHFLIHQEMTFLVRHLAPTAQGLPLEIYVFSRDQRWANYEALQADIFDHILAAVPLFDLRVFQYPAGQDLRRLTVTLPQPDMEN
ncbi:MAG: mechanosensitive ion channel family protein, partial [Desulfobulbaceae bacterium]|nr:mechanosensitive ion channel family protein [Desulfobulbaceae bacterium]